MTATIALNKPTEFTKSLFDSTSAIKEAKAAGFCVVLPQSNELQVDIDSPIGQETFDKNLVFLQNYVELTRTLVAPSKSGVSHRKHVTLTLKRDVTPMERILLQLLLGSDLQREMYSYCRVLNGDQYPTLFFEKDSSSSAGTMGS